MNAMGGEEMTNMVGFFNIHFRYRTHPSLTTTNELNVFKKTSVEGNNLYQRLQYLSLNY